LLIADIKIDASFRRGLSTIPAIIFWAPYTVEGNLKMMGLSKALNHVHDTKMEESQFMIVARQIRQIWKEWGSPLQSTAISRGSKWKVCNIIMCPKTFAFRSYEPWFVTFSYQFWPFR
jgi:hypothetical protein